MLTLVKIDLEWADGQYWETLWEVIGEISNCYKKPQKHKLNANEIKQFIREDGEDGGN